MADYRPRTGQAGLRIGGIFGSSGSRANIALNAAYVNRTSGPAVGIRIRCETNEPINELYILLDAIVGTRTNITMRADLYDYGTTTQPGTTLRASSDVATLPATDDRWIRFVFSTPYTPTAGEYVYAVFHNLAVAPVTDHPLVFVDSAASFDINHHFTEGYSSINGFSTAGTNRSELAHVVVQGASTVYGLPVTLLSSITAFTGRRGILLSQEIKKYKISFLRTSSPSTALIDFQVFDLSTPPTGTPLYSQALLPQEESLGEVLLNLDCSTLPGTGPFVFCLSTSSSLAQGGTGLIEGYSDFPSVFDLFSSDNFANPATVTEVAGNWVVDRSRLMGGFAFDVSGIVASSGSSPQPFMRGSAF